MSQQNTNNWIKLIGPALTTIIIVSGLISTWAIMETKTAEIVPRSEIEKTFEIVHVKIDTLKEMMGELQESTKTQQLDIKEILKRLPRVG